MLVQNAHSNHLLSPANVQPLPGPQRWPHLLLVGGRSRRVAPTNGRQADGALLGQPRGAQRGVVPPRGLGARQWVQRRAGAVAEEGHDLLQLQPLFQPCRGDGWVGLSVLYEAEGGGRGQRFKTMRRWWKQWFLTIKRPALHKDEKVEAQRGEGDRDQRSTTMKRWQRPAFYNDEGSAKTSAPQR